MTPSYPAFFMDMQGGPGAPYGTPVDYTNVSTPAYNEFLTYPPGAENGGFGGHGAFGLNGVSGLGLSGLDTAGQRTITMDGLDTPLASSYNALPPEASASISEYFTEEPQMMHEHFPEFLSSRHHSGPSHSQFSEGTSASFTTPHITASPAFSDLTPMLSNLDDDDPRFAAHFADADNTPVIQNFDDFDDVLGEEGGANALLAGTGFNDGLALFGGMGVEDGSDEFRFKSPSPAPQAMRTTRRVGEPSRSSSSRASGSNTSSRSNSGLYAGHEYGADTHATPLPQQMPTPNLSPLLSSF
jgi:hypothetical protein